MLPDLSVFFQKTWKNNWRILLNCVWEAQYLSNKNWRLFIYLGTVHYLIFFEKSFMLLSPLIFDDCIELHEYRNIHSFITLIFSWCTFKMFDTFLLFYT